MPWGPMTNVILASAKSHGILEKITTVWWGQSHDSTLDFVGVKALAMTSTSVSPVAIPAGLSPSLFTQGVREAILVVEAARAAVLSNLADFTYVKDDGITYEGALTVTAKMMTESLAWKPSISPRIWFKVCSRSS